MSARYLAVLLPLAACASTPSPRQATADHAAWAEQCADWDAWDAPGPPFRIHGNTYYVGTCGISAILVTGDEGHTLIDSGTEAGAEIVATNIAKLGFSLRDVKVLLMSHEHHDHVGGTARLKELTGALVVASSAAAEALRRGSPNPEDPQFEIGDGLPPARVDIVLGDRPVELGGLELEAIPTPGHTPGALSWQWRSCDGADCRTIVYADSLSPVSGDSYRFSDHPAYLAAFRDSLDRVAKLKCDLLLTPHPSASGLRDKLIKGDIFGEPLCGTYAEGLRKRLYGRVVQEKAR